MKKRILILPDSFKGSMSSLEVCNILEESIKAVDESQDYLSIPLSDGGEGFLDFYKSNHRQAKLFSVEIDDWDKSKVNTRYIIDGNKAIIETAEVIGLPHAKKSILQRSSYGVGVLINHILKHHNCNEIIVSIGGTATVDMGLGMLHALGGIFIDVNGNHFIPLPSKMNDYSEHDFSNINISQKITVLSDVDNKLYGPQGGLEVYSPQKGATQKQIEKLSQLYNKIIPLEADKNCFGSGGGLGAALIYFLDSHVKMGMDFVIETINLEKLVKNSELVIGGEGSVDDQSFQGKVIGRLHQLCRKYQKTLIVFAGTVSLKDKNSFDNTFIFSIHSSVSDFHNFNQTSRYNLKQQSETVIRLWAKSNR